MSEDRSAYWERKYLESVEIIKRVTVEHNQLRASIKRSGLKSLVCSTCSKTMLAREGSARICFECFTSHDTAPLELDPPRLKVDAHDQRFA